MSFEFHGNREMSDERSLLEIEMPDKIKRVAEILDVLEGLEGGGGSGFVLERAEISDGKITVDLPLWELCLKTDKVWVIVVPRGRKTHNRVVKKR